MLTCRRMKDKQQTERMLLKLIIRSVGRNITLKIKTNFGTFSLLLTFLNQFHQISFALTILFLNLFRLMTSKLVLMDLKCFVKALKG